MWGACTRAGAGGRPTHEHLDYYLDEFTFRFNRRRSRSRGKLFFRLVQQAVAIDPAPLRVVGQIRQNAVIWRPQHVGVT